MENNEKSALNKPQFGTEIFKCSCGSKDNVHLLLDSEREGDYITWCSCGMVSIRKTGIVSDIFNFAAHK